MKPDWGATALAEWMQHQSKDTLLSILQVLSRRCRSGRAGVYYHVSYLGKPHDYLWMSTTSPSLMYEELRKAYDTTADRIWLLNVGDIKSCEASMNLFLAMA